MATLVKHRKNLLLIAKSSPRTAKKILKTASPGLVKAIAEIALNALTGVIPLPPKHRDKLKRHRKNLRDVVNGKNNKIRYEIMQRGGWVSTLLATALPFVINGISKLIGAIKRRKSKKKTSRSGKK